MIARHVRDQAKIIILQILVLGVSHDRLMVDL